MTEEWRAIEGYEGYYEVSNRGRVRSLDRVVVDKRGRPRNLPGRIRTPGALPMGYLHISLGKNGKSRWHYIHRLVAKHFLPLSDLPEVNHIDMDKANNTVENLEWVSHKENHAHYSNSGTRSAAYNPKLATKLTTDIVRRIHADRKSGLSSREIGERYGIRDSSVARILRGKQWKTLHPDYQEAAP